MLGFFKRRTKDPPMDELLLTEPIGPKPTLIRLAVRVPAGFPLPEGIEVRDPFDLTVEAGVRWHPEWSEPRITVNAFRFFEHGDCLCWSGETVEGFPLPEEVLALAKFHGQPLDHWNKVVVTAAQLGIPTAPEPMASFIATPMRRTIH